MNTPGVYRKGKDNNGRAHLYDTPYDISELIGSKPWKINDAIMIKKKKRLGDSCTKIVAARGKAEKKPDIGYLATVGEKEPSSRGGGKRRAVNDAGVNCECVSSRIYASRRCASAPYGTGIDARESRITIISDDCLPPFSVCPGSSVIPRFSLSLSFSLFSLSLPPIASSFSRCAS